MPLNYRRWRAGRDNILGFLAVLLSGENGGENGHVKNSAHVARTTTTKRPDL